MASGLEQVVSFLMDYYSSAGLFNDRSNDRSNWKFYFQ